MLFVDFRVAFDSLKKYLEIFNLETGEIRKHHQRCNGFDYCVLYNGSLHNGIKCEAGVLVVSDHFPDSAG